MLSSLCDPGDVLKMLFSYQVSADDLCICAKNPNPTPAFCTLVPTALWAFLPGFLEDISNATCAELKSLSTPTDLFLFLYSWFSHWFHPPQSLPSLETATLDSSLFVATHPSSRSPLILSQVPQYISSSP